MTTRRHLLAGLAATALAPRLGWAEAGSPAYLAAARDGARDGAGAYRLVGLSDQGAAVFSVPLPERGHGARIDCRAAGAVSRERRGRCAQGRRARSGG